MENTQTVEENDDDDGELDRDNIQCLSDHDSDELDYPDEGEGENQ